MSSNKQGYKAKEVMVRIYLEKYQECWWNLSIWGDRHFCSSMCLASHLHFTPKLCSKKKNLCITLKQIHFLLYFYEELWNRTKDLKKLWRLRCCKIREKLSRLRWQKKTRIEVKYQEFIWVIVPFRSPLKRLVKIIYKLMKII